MRLPITKIALLTVFMSGLGYAQSPTRSKAQSLGVDTLYSNRPGDIYVNDTLNIIGYARANNIEAVSGDVINIWDTTYVRNFLKQSGGSVWFDGTTGATPTSGAGTRLMWIPSKKALRVGNVTATQWDTDSVGVSTVVFGFDNKITATDNVSGVGEGRTIGIWGGGGNSITNYSGSGGIRGISFILGGESNSIESSNGFIIGGSSNLSSTNYGAIINSNSSTSLGGVRTLILNGLSSSIADGLTNVFLTGINVRATQSTTFLFGHGNSADTLNYGHGFFTRHVPLVIMAKDTTVSGLTGTGQGRVDLGLFHERTADTTAYFLSMQRSSATYNTGDFVIEKTWGVRNAVIDIPKSLEMLRFVGSDNSINFNYAKHASASYGNIYVRNGNFILDGTASNIALGSNFISNGGTDAGLSFDASNNATLSGTLGSGAITSSGLIKGTVIAGAAGQFGNVLGTGSGGTDLWISDSTAGKFGSLGIYGNRTGANSTVANFSFQNKSSVSANDEIAQIRTLTGGTASAGRFIVNLANWAGTSSVVAYLDTAGLTLGTTSQSSTGALSLWANNGNFSGSLSVTGTGTHTIGGAGSTIDVATSVADTSAFVTTATRAAVFISGALSTDKYYVSHRNLTGTETLPVAGDQLSYYAKADSLIVLRAAGTTSGQKFSYLRLR